MTRRRTTVIAVAALALVVAIAATALGVLYGGADTAQAAGSPVTVTSVCVPAACAQQGQCAGQGGNASCPMAGGAQGASATSCPMAAGNAAGGSCCGR